MVIVCFLGATGSGKSHTIRELLSDANPCKSRIVSADTFGSVTLCETVYKVSDEFTLVDTRGLDSEDLGDDEILAGIEATIASLGPADEAIFVLVVNDAERRLTAVRLASRLVGGRQVLIYLNKRNNDPIDKHWSRCYVETARREALAKAMGRAEASHLPITDRHWAIVPHLRAMVLGVPPSCYKGPAHWIEAANLDAMAKYARLGLLVASAMEEALVLRRRLEAQIRSFEANRHLQRRYDNTFLAFLFATSPEGSAAWAAYSLPTAEALGELQLRSDLVGEQARALAGALEHLRTMARQVARATLDSGRDWALPALPVVSCPPPPKDVTTVRRCLA